MVNSGGWGKATFPPDDKQKKILVCIIKWFVPDIRYLNILWCWAMHSTCIWSVGEMLIIYERNKIQIYDPLKALRPEISSQNFLMKYAYASNQFMARKLTQESAYLWDGQPPSPPPSCGVLSSGVEWQVTCVDTTLYHHRSTLSFTPAQPPPSLPNKHRGTGPCSTTVCNIPGFL